MQIWDRGSPSGLGCLPKSLGQFLEHSTRLEAIWTGKTACPSHSAASFPDLSWTDFLSGAVEMAW